MEALMGVLLLLWFIFIGIVGGISLVSPKTIIRWCALIARWQLGDGSGGRSNWMANLPGPSLETPLIRRLWGASTMGEWIEQATQKPPVVSSVMVWYTRIMGLAFLLVLALTVAVGLGAFD